MVLQGLVPEARGVLRRDQPVAEPEVRPGRALPEEGGDPGGDAAQVVERLGGLVPLRAVGGAPHELAEGPLAVDAVAYEQDAHVVGAAEPRDLAAAEAGAVDGGGAVVSAVLEVGGGKDVVPGGEEHGGVTCSFLAVYWITHAFYSRILKSSTVYLIMQYFF